MQLKKNFVTVVTKSKSSLGEHSNILEVTRERISELENGLIKFMPSEQQVESRLGDEVRRSSETYATVTEDLTFVLLDSRRAREECGNKKYS